MNINLTLFGQTLAFAIFVWFCMKFVWPPVTAAMQRTPEEDRRRSGCRRPCAARPGTGSREGAPTPCARPRNRLLEILEQANKRANSIVEEAKEQARAEGERLVAGAHAEIEQEVNRAKDATAQPGSGSGRRRCGEDPGVPVDAKAHNDLVEKLASRTLSEASDGMNTQTLARPYAKAAFEFARPPSRLDAWSAMLNLAAVAVEVT